MMQFKYDPEFSSGWKSYPVRLVAPGLSKCHQLPRLLVQSMEGGFVTVDCSQCGEQSSLSSADFKSLPVWVSCPKCQRKMRAALVPGSAGKSNNYGFRCLDYQLYIRLADLIPKWSDIF